MKEVKVVVFFEEIDGKQVIKQIKLFEVLNLAELNQETKQQENEDHHEREHQS